MDTYDFSGWATRNDLKCSDGRVIRRDAFKDCDGQIVPIVWNHQHDNPGLVLGHALLENRDEGVYTYGSFNDTEMGVTAKTLVKHGDIRALSIYANQLRQNGPDVIHGTIREVSLVHAGANPGAFIESVLSHGEESDEEAIIYTGEYLSLAHAEEEQKEEETVEETKPVEEVKAEEAIEHAAESSEKTLGEIVDSMTEEQKEAMYALIGLAIEQNDAEEDSVDEGEEEMKHNVFDNEETNKEGVLMHSDGTPVTVEEVSQVFADTRRYGSLKDSALAHGITDVEYLFPEDHLLNNPPAFIQRDMGWVGVFLNGVHHTPFSRIKSQFADITGDDARALGYIKGNLKKEEVFSLLKRSTAPTTIYKKQKMDRDDIIDITDFDVVSWLKTEMRMMLNEEIARAALIGDGRLSSSDDKISEQNIRPIYNDADLYTIKAQVSVAANATEDDKAKAFIRAAIKARKDYKGSGNPILFTTEDMLTDMLLLTDTTGRDLYTDEAQLAKKLRVSRIVTVPVMEGAKGVNDGDLAGIIVNLNDYNIGADRGGAINMFDDFDIDYNQQKYLIETRCSGALVKPYSAIALEFVETQG